MPLLSVSTSAAVASNESANELLRALSQYLARELSKPEQYVMTVLRDRERMTFGGTDASACYVELKNVGRFTPEQTRRLSKALCERLSAGLGVPSDRIYIEFANADGHLWGFDGNTFG